MVRRAFTPTAIPTEAATPCRTHDAEMWFSDSPSVLKEAIRLCVEECPFRMECANEAEINREAFGVWGGFYRRYRRVTQVPQRKGRPRVVVP